MGGETRVSDGLVQRAGHAARGLAPGYFALVMPSSIISLGLHLEGFASLSSVLAWVCAGGFVVLTTLTVLRLVGYRAEIARDFTDPRRAFGLRRAVVGAGGVGRGLRRDDPARVAHRRRRAFAATAGAAP